MKEDLSILMLRSPFLEHSEGSDLVPRPHESKNWVIRGLSVSPSDILVKECFFLIMICLASNRVPSQRKKPGHRRLETVVKNTFPSQSPRDNGKSQTAAA